MDLFHKIEDAQAIVRRRGGVYSQTDVYRRAGRIYVKAGGGFVRVEAKFGDYWGTTNPNVNVLDISEGLL